MNEAAATTRDHAKTGLAFVAGLAIGWVVIGEVWARLNIRAVWLAAGLAVVAGAVAVKKDRARPLAVGVLIAAVGLCALFTFAEWSLSGFERQ